jgi:hypothetical protein
MTFRRARQQRIVGVDGREAHRESLDRPWSGHISNDQATSSRWDGVCGAEAAGGRGGGVMPAGGTTTSPGVRVGGVQERLGELLRRPAARPLAGVGWNLAHDRDGVRVSGDRMHATAIMDGHSRLSFLGDRAN